jgi:type I restriction enzyme R subunit
MVHRLKPYYTTGDGKKPDPEFYRLSNILKTFHEQFGELFTDSERVVRLIIENIAPRVAMDQPYRNAKKNTPNAASIELDAALTRAIGSLLLEGDNEFCKQFVQNKPFKRFVTDIVVKLTAS